jgi:glycosyltransferase involved in cell wall biosynthesis
MPPAPSKTIAVFISFSGTGGVERMVTNLVQGFVAQGHPVDLLTLRAEGPHLDRLPAAVNRISLGTDHSLLALPALIGYLRRRRPAALLAAKDRAGRVAVLARALSGVPTRLVLRLGTHLSAAMEEKSALSRWFRYWPIRWLYPSVDQIVAVSEGVAEDTARVAGIARARIRVIRNPVITPELAALAAEPLWHPWFQPGEPPVILGAGRLQRQKDFPTLLRAFAQVATGRPCRLVILGEGRGRAGLQALIDELGLRERVDLVGFHTNPFPLMAHARLFVLSSAWEGSPNVLTEAMALGTPVVATDCPSGPRELLAGGRYGPLVAVGDVAGLAAAIAQTLHDPLPAATLRAAVSEYNLATSVDQYREVLGIPHRPPVS